MASHEEERKAAALNAVLVMSTWDHVLVPKVLVAEGMVGSPMAGVLHTHRQRAVYLEIFKNCVNNPVIAMNPLAEPNVANRLLGIVVGFSDALRETAVSLLMEYGFNAGMELTIAKKATLTP